MKLNTDSIFKANEHYLINDSNICLAWNVKDSTLIDLNILEKNILEFLNTKPLSPKVINKLWCCYNTFLLPFLKNLSQVMLFVLNIRMEVYWVKK